MPQVDLETLVSACAGASCDNKIACETLSDDHRRDCENDPPESFWLSKDAEIDWFDRNAFIERKDSTKGSSNSANLNPNINPNPSNSQRFSNLKSKASIIGLPKPQKYETKIRRCKGNTHLFPKRSGSTTKSDAAMIEPSSPKVSCIGRVRSKRERSRRLRNRQRSVRSTESDPKKEIPERRHKAGFMASFRAIFRSKSTAKNTEKKKDASQRKSSARKSAGVRTHDIRDRLPSSDTDAPPRNSVERDGSEAVAGGLGGMKRFTSGRKSGLLGVGGDVA